MPGVNTDDRRQYQDLSSAEAVIDQRNTPFWDRIKAGPKLENHKLYSQAVDTTGKRRKQGMPERTDVKGYEGDQGAEIYGRAERFHREPQVSREAETFSAASASKTMKDFASQKRAKIIELTRDVDFTILGDQESQPDDGINGYFLRAAGRTVNDGSTGAATSQGGDSPSSLTAGVASLDFNDTPTAVPTNLRTSSAQIYAGALTDFSEESATDMMQHVAERTGSMLDFVLWCAAGLKRHISTNFGRYVADKPGYTTVARVNVSDSDRSKLTMGVDVFQGDWGTFTVEWEPWMPTNQRGYGLSMSEIKKRIAYHLRFEPQDDKGGGQRGMIDSILSVWFGDPRKHFKICPSSETAAVVNFDF